MPHNNRCFHWWFSVLQVSSIFTAVFSSVTGPVYVLKYVGEDAKFTWTTDGQPFKSIQFGISNAAKTDVTAPALFTSNLNRVVLSGPNTTDPVYQGRLHFYGNVSSGHATFEIKNIRVSDEHTYLVMIKEKGAPSEQKYNVIRMGTLTIRVAPTFASQLNSPHDITEGQDLSITCSADGVPTPNITWIWNDSVKDHGTGNATLSITGITRDKKGIYECQAINDPAKSPIKIQTTVNVQYPPVISPLQSITVNKGERITLPCSATTGNPPPTVSWSKVGQSTLPGVSFTTPGPSQKTLSIAKTGKSHAGEYVCTAKNVYGGKLHEVTASAVVIVNYPPSILNSSLPSTVNDGDLLQIFCTADGYPIPTITWYKSGTTLGQGKYHNVTSATRSDTGTYTCTAKNGMDPIASSDIEVTVNYIPEIDVSLSSSNTSSWKGNQITLTCKAIGVPTPTFEWFSPNGNKITNGVTDASGGSQVVKVTTDNSVDYGQYKCRATNSQGSDERSIHVTQLFPPGPPVVSIHDIKAASFTVKWIAPANNGGSAVIDYKVEVSNKTLEKIIKSELLISKSELLISELDKNTEYTVRVFARNDVGYGTPGTKTIRTKKQGPPSLLIMPPSVNETTDTEIILKWKKLDENGGEIKKYTIYSKVTFPDGKKTAWRERHVITDGSVLEYKVKDLEAGRTYSFLVTATNEYGESVKDYTKAIVIRITKAKEPDKGKRTTPKGSSTPIIAGAAVGGIVLLVVIAAVFVVMARKKRLQGQGSSKARRDPDDIIDPYDSVDHEHAAANLGNNGNQGPMYAAVDMSKKTKKRKDEEPTYAEVDRPKKRKPGEIIYAELADFNNSAEESAQPASRPAAYQETAYADINDFQRQEPEPTYGNVPRRGADTTYDNIQSM